MFWGCLQRDNCQWGRMFCPIAIKRLNHNSEVGATDFWQEISMLSGLHHSNLVSLIGYCDDVKETILVYEFMSNGTLKDHLHVLGTDLTWRQRIKICLDAAYGLHYLHTARPRVVHCDIRSSNILLNENWDAKISDFGLSKIGPKDVPSTAFVTFSKGTFGYLDPYSLPSGKLTMESDVYSFGVVLFEILCGRLAVDHKQQSLVTWVQDSVKYNWMETSQRSLKDTFGIAKGSLEDIIDSNLRNEISPISLNTFSEIAFKCLHEVPKQRPTMSEVIRSLESALVSQNTFNNPLQSTTSLKEFTFRDIEIATKWFSRDLLMGEGGFGKVFQGCVEENTLAPLENGVGIDVAVKQITSEVPRMYNEWLEDVNFLGQLGHPNIIRLLGFCNKNQHEYLLVYEHMEKSLSDFIHGDHHLEPLTWGARLKVMIGVARGLTHLYTKKGVLCQFQCDDILLDEDFTAKIGGFGWMKTQERHNQTQLKGVFGYLKADYDISTGHLIMKNDICSFGLVLLETLSGRHLSNLEDVLEGLESLEMRAPKSKSNRRKLQKMMDPRLKGGYSPEGAFKCMTLALRCITIQPEYRPSREEILWSLEQVYALNQ